MNPKPRPSIKKKAAAKEMARANRLAAKQQAQKAHAATTGARNEPQKETTPEKTKAESASNEARKKSAGRNDVAVFESRKNDIMRFSAAASKAQKSLGAHDSDRSLDMQNPNRVDTWQRKGIDDAWTNSSFFAAEQAVGMKAASQYKRETGLLHSVACVLGVLASIIALVAVVVGGTLTIKEFRPKDSIAVDISNPSEISLEQNRQISFITWDIGYCGLSSNADSFLYGGNSVRPTSKDGVENNLQSIEETLLQQDTDFVLLQEVDQKSDRSHKIDEVSSISKSMAQSGHSYAFAKDYDVFFVPFPIPPIGTINSGLMTHAKYASISAERISAYNPLKWPRSTISAKPCLLEERFSVDGSNKQLVVINVNLGRYDNENERAQQVAQLALIVKREADKGNYIVVGGNFNQVFSNVKNPYPQTSQDLWTPGILNADAFEEGTRLLMDTDVPTARSLAQAFDANKNGFQFYMTDGFIASENVKIESVETLNLSFENSSHNPVKLIASLE